MDTKSFYTIEDIMKILQIGKSTAYKLFNSRSFPSTKIGGNYRISAKLFDKWVESQAGKEFNL